MSLAGTEMVYSSTPRPTLIVFMKQHTYDPWAVLGTRTNFLKQKKQCGGPRIHQATKWCSFEWKKYI